MPRILEPMQAPVVFDSPDKLKLIVKPLDALPRGSGTGRLFVNCVGPNGSGKSRFGRFLILNDPDAFGFKGQQGRIIGTVYPNLGWASVGRYQTQCGGADFLVKSMIMESIELICATPLHLYLDGIMASDTRETYWKVALNLVETYKRKSVIVVLDYPLATCIKRIYARNKGRAIREDVVKNKFQNIQRRAKLWESRIHDGAPIILYRENHEGVEPMIRSIKMNMDYIARENVLPGLPI